MILYLLCFSLLYTAVVVEAGNCNGFEHCSSCNSYGGSSGRPATITYSCSGSSAMSTNKCFASFPAKVTSLDLSFDNCNAITSTDFASYVNLTSLILKNEGIKTVAADAFKNLQQITKIELTYNRISRLEANTFNNLPFLMDIDLSGNSDPSQGESLYLAPGVFGDKILLNSLTLSKNAISNFNDMSKILAKFRVLQKLDLSDSGLTDLPAGVLPAAQISQINLAENKLTQVKANAFKDVQGLTGVELRDNQITTIDPNAFVSKTLLNIGLSGNQITTFPSDPFKIGKRFGNVYLSYNKITTLSPGDLSGVNVTSLYLDHNPITSIQPGAFKGNNVGRLDISYTDLGTLPSPSILNELNGMKLSFNGLNVTVNCDCATYKFFNAMGELYRMGRDCTSKNPRHPGVFYSRGSNSLDYLIYKCRNN